MRFKWLYFLASFVFLAVSCKKDPDIVPPPVSESGTINLNIRPYGGTIPAYLGTTLLHPGGRKMKIEVFKMLLHDIRLVKADNSTLQLKDFYLLNLASSAKTTHAQGWNIQSIVPTGEYKGLQFSVGVPVSLNHPPGPDPATYPDGHPLSLTEGMAWSWADGYRFIIVEGKIDSSASMNGINIDQPFLYHTGLDSMYRTLQFNTPAFAVNANAEKEFVLEMDMMRFFYTEGVDTFDILTHPYSHSTPYGSANYNVGLNITNRMTDAWYKVPF